MGNVRKEAQYCKYCKKATKIDEKTFICWGDCASGRYGWGKAHNKAKAKKVNRCREFAFAERDIFSGKTYLPHKNVMYYRVTDDLTEQIEFIADTSKELAEMCGVKRTTVLKGVERYEKGQCNSRYRRIVLREE